MLEIDNPKVTDKGSYLLRDICLEESDALQFANKSLPLRYCGQTVSCCFIHIVPRNRLASIRCCFVVLFGGFSSLQFADITGPLRPFLCICKIHLIRFIIYRLLYSVRILWNIVGIYKQEFQLHCIQYSNTIIFKELK